MLLLRWYYKFINSCCARRSPTSVECNQLSGVSPTSVECNQLSGVSPTSVECNQLSGVSPTSVECNQLSGVSPTSVECNQLSGVSPTSVECNQLSGVCNLSAFTWETSVRLGCEGSKCSEFLVLLAINHQVTIVDLRDAIQVLTDPEAQIQTN